MRERKTETKNNLLTIRLTDEESSYLEYLSGSMDRSKTDVITRACKFLMNADVPHAEENDDENKKLKTVRVHLRMADSDVEDLKVRGRETGETVSELIRRAIRAFAEMSNTYY